MIYFCCDERRRNTVKEHPTLNGIDFLEVSDDPADPYEVRQRTLFVHFLKPLIIGSPPMTSPPAGTLERNNVLIEGGERMPNIKITDVTIGGISSPPFASPPLSSPPSIASANVLVVVVAEPGDFSTYTLRLVRDAERVRERGTDHDSEFKEPPHGFDPVLSAVDFSFKAACPSDFDCRTERVCPSEPKKEPDINYLAKDYSSFRQLMLDRMAVLPGRERTQSGGHGRSIGGVAGLCRRLLELSARRDRNRELSRDRAAPDFTAAPYKVG